MPVPELYESPIVTTRRTPVDAVVGVPPNATAPATRHAATDQDHRFTADRLDGPHRT